MAEAPGRSRMVDGERKLGRRRKRTVSDDIKKESTEKQTSEEVGVPSEEPSLPECAVCLQTCVYPARLPCSHIFCFLCLKGIASQSRRCAMCRQDIPQDYLEHPDLVQVPLLSDKSNNKDSSNIEGGYQWFYEGRNGWWQYDERTSCELESSYKEGNRNCELLIAGFLYIADFDSMLQLRRNEPSRYRRIKRDLATIPKKGIAGIRTPLQTDSLIEQMSNLSISSAESPQTILSSGTTSNSNFNSLNHSEEVSESRAVNNN